MIKTLGNPENKRYIGDTAGLRKLESQGMRLTYSVCDNVSDVVYAPRSKSDPMPWAQVGGLESRLRATEIVAVEAQPEETVKPSAPRYITHSFPAGPHSIFAVKDTVTQSDVASFYSRYAAREKADRLNSAPDAETKEAALAVSGACGHGFAPWEGVTASVRCEFGREYGVFGTEGPISKRDCAVRAANDAWFDTNEDEDGIEYTVKVVCPDHEYQAKDTCEECDS